MLRFERVDWNSSVFVGGKRLGGHTGGYSPFAFALPPAEATGDADTEIVVVAVDWTEDNPRHWQPRGKQVRQPHSIDSIDSPPTQLPPHPPPGKSIRRIHSVTHALASWQPHSSNPPSRPVHRSDRRSPFPRG